MGGHGRNEGRGARDDDAEQRLLKAEGGAGARGTGGLSISNSVMNAGEAQNIASRWSRILRNGFDKAHGIGKK